jgi:2-keto-3-deoxy-L-rhamnonate aldolase RhmA
MNIPGEFTHPEFLTACKKIETVAKKHNRALGCLTGTPNATVDLYKAGYDVLCYSGDVWLYQKALIDGITEIRTKCI